MLAFGPMIATGLWLRMTGSATATESGGHIPHVDLGFPLYAATHSVVTFAVAYGVVSLLSRSPASSLLGWLLHILIDVPTHSFQYYATRLLWPLADYRFDGVPWWTPWLWACTYAGLVIAYFLFWRRGWLTRRPSPTLQVRLSM